MPPEHTATEESAEHNFFHICPPMSMSVDNRFCSDNYNHRMQQKKRPPREAVLYRESDPTSVIPPLASSVGQTSKTRAEQQHGGWLRNWITRRSIINAQIRQNRR